MKKEEVDFFDFLRNEVLPSILDQPATLLFLLILGAIWIYNTINNYKENDAFKGTYYSVIMFIVVIVFPYSFILLTEILAYQAFERGFFEIDRDTILVILRWLGLFGVLPPLCFVITYKKSKFKSTIIFLRHLFVLLGGWLLGKWAGIIFFSIPIFTIFYLRLYHTAPMIYPASNPESKEEKKKKFWAFFWYVWGLQYPVWIAESSAARDTEIRVEGDYFEDYGSPGITWAYSHQAIGYSVGIEFTRVDGPGITFTTQYERPEAIVDLRTQLRPTPFEAITKDGIAVNAIVFIAFKIDPENWAGWEREKRHRVLRVSPILEKGFELDQKIGSYPYSTARVHAALSRTSIRQPKEEEENQDPKVYWDEVVVQHVVKQASLALSERNFDEMWAPKIDGRGKSALDEIAEEIKEKAVPGLEEMGIILFSSRVVNFIIDKEDPLRKQLTESWLKKWEHKVAQINLEANTEAEKLRTEAESAAKHNFLNTVNHSLRKARNIDQDLPKQVVALNFISTLEGLLEGLDDENSAEKIAKLEAWKKFILQGKEGGAYG